MKFKKGVIILLTLALCFSLTGCNKKLPKEETLSQVLKDGGYKVVFEDQFDGNEVDMTKWIVGYPTTTRSAAYYVEDAVKVKDGNLIITTNYRENGELGKGWYTGWMESADSTSHIMGTTNPHIRDNFEGFSAKFGYFEVKCKLPKGIGMWSAFWLMPCEKGPGMTQDEDILGTATDGVEIDVMESFNFGAILNKNLNTHVVHMDGYSDNLKSLKSPLIDIGEDLYDTYHTYGVLRTESEYVFYIDGKESWRTDGTYDGKNYGVSEVNECLLLTCEVPGMDIDHPGRVMNEKGKLKKHWSGDVMKNDLNTDIEFIVDYVKVYQK